MSKKTTGIIEIVIGVAMLIVAWYMKTQLYRHTGVESLTFGSDFYTEVYHAAGVLTHQMVDLFDMVSDGFSVLFAFFGVKELARGIGDVKSKTLIN